MCVQNILLGLLDLFTGEIYVPLWVKKGTLKFPKDKDIPVIMVGPGTGVAPFRSALQERIPEGKHSTQWFVFFTLIWHQDWGFQWGLLLCFCHLVNVLFFGCRSESKDFYFRSEWEKAEKMGHLTLYTAFSRDQVRRMCSSQTDFFFKWQVIICSLFQVWMVCLTTVKFIHMTIWDQIVSEMG